MQQVPEHWAWRERTAATSYDTKRTRGDTIVLGVLTSAKETRKQPTKLQNVSEELAEQRSEENPPSTSTAQKSNSDNRDGKADASQASGCVEGNVNVWKKLWVTSKPKRKHSEWRVEENSPKENQDESRELDDQAAESGGPYSTHEGPWGPKRQCVV